MSACLPKGISDEAKRAADVLLACVPPSEAVALGLWLGRFFVFQLDWLLHFGRLAVINKSRQIGISFSTAAAAVLWAVCFGETTTIVSKTKKDSEEVLLKAKGHLLALQRFGSERARGRLLKSEIVLPNGGRIIALPATSGARGFAGNVILDELAYHTCVGGPAKVWEAAVGSITHGYKLRAISTPNGIGNFFHLLWENSASDPRYARYEIPLERAIADGMKVDIDYLWSFANGDPRLFAQLYQCSFLDDALQYVPSDAIEACTRDVTWSALGECHAGIDVGKEVDRTELLILRTDPRGVRWVQYGESLKRTRTTDLERMVALALGPPWNCRRVCIDATGIGAFPSTDLQARYGEHRVEPVKFTLQSKEDLATRLYSAFCGVGPATDDGDGSPLRGTVRIPRSDPQLALDVASIRRLITSAGNVRYDAPRTKAGHADKAWALALALLAGESPRPKTEIEDGAPRGPYTMIL